MKNLLTRNIDYDNLQESHARSKKYDQWWGTSSTEDHVTDGIWPWDRAKHILKKYIGKSINKAFSKYCEQVPIYQQRYFWKEVLQPGEIYSRWGGKDFKLDAQNRVQLAKPKTPKAKPVLVSKDYEILYRLKPEISIGKKDALTGLIFEDRELSPYEYNHYVKNKLPHAKYYGKVEIGKKQQFESTKDPRFVRIKQEEQKKNRRDRKFYRKSQQEKEYTLLSRKELDKKRQRAIDNLKIVAKGFDLETSFRNEK